MRIASVAGFSFLGMVATSVTVWFATTPEHAASALASAEPLGSGAVAPLVVPPHELHLAGTVALDGRLGHAVVPAGKAAETYVYVDLKADPQRVAPQGVPLALAIVIDRSGSMRGQRLSNALAAARGAIARLRDGDMVSVLTYNTIAEVVVPATRVSASVRQDIDRKLAAVVAAGDTCISCGLAAGRSAMPSQSGMVKRIMLLSDGEPTAGVLAVDDFRNIAAGLAAEDISVTTIGVDVDYNEKVMSALALESNGRDYFVENADSLPKIFDQEVASLTRTVASHAEFAFQPAPGVEVTTVYDRAHRRAGRGVTVPLGTFAAGEEKTVLLRVSVPPTADGQLAVGAVSFRYRDVTTSRQEASEGRLALSASKDVTSLGPVDPIVQLRLNRSAVRAAIEDANQLFKAGRVQEARARLQTQIAATRAASAGAAQAPAKQRSKIDREYAKQSTTLDQADDGFGDGANAAAEREGRAQVRANADEATEMGY